MPAAKLTPSERRALVLAALRGEETVQALAHRYGLARSWVYTLVDEAAADPTAAVAEARDELAFREAVADLLWSEAEVALAYRESSSPQRAAFECLAEHPETWVQDVDIARKVYPALSDTEACSKLYGSLGNFGGRSYRYGKPKWFFRAKGKRNRDGTPSSMAYYMTAEKAAWVLRASGRQETE